VRATSAQKTAAANVKTETIQYESGGFTIDAFIARSAGDGKHPAVLIIHDSQGLNDSVREIARQFAAAGFFALAPDLVSRLGRKSAPEQNSQNALQLPPNVTVTDVQAAFAYLQKDPEVDATRISTVGFGWGGWRSLMLAASTPDLYRAVEYCGTTPSQSLEASRAPVLAHYAQFDFRTTGNALVTEKMMSAAGKKFSYFVYPQTNRGFYFMGSQYNADAARLAWNRTLDFLKN
jgi:carboxymethylenebutenolidase